MPFDRACGTLLHPTSLPGPHGSGDLGEDACRFIDWLESAGQSVWQILPLGEIGSGYSPYMSPSAFAGNTCLIDLSDLERHGWLEPAEVEPVAGGADDQIDFAQMLRFRGERLVRAATRFAAVAGPAQRAEYSEYCRAQSGWLDDFALFVALSERFPDRHWCDWEAPLAMREPAALARATREFSSRIQQVKFAQWTFSRQWRRLRSYANERGVAILGDAPIFVAYHSADVWTRRELFDLDPSGRPRVVAGVPPDYFSENGQLWGNPLYRWEAHRQEAYSWWIDRLRCNLERYDWLRLDHFLGFVNYWEVPADAETAIDGRWLPGPGAELFEYASAVLGDIPIVAENLGSVTPEVEALRRRLGYPGMAVLQFAWSGDPDNPHLPHNIERNTVLYTGTHDNDTLLGWWSALDEPTRQQVREYLQTDCAEPHWDLVRCALSSRADTVIVPLQDYLGLGTGERMNTPGQANGNWSWRFEWPDLPVSLAARIAGLCARHGRFPGKASE